MKNNLAFKVSGSIFLIVAVAHLSRIILQFPVVIGSFSVPVWFSGLTAYRIIIRVCYLSRGLDNE